MKLKIQTNDYNVNVVVMIKGSRNHQHIGPGDYFDGDVMSDEEIEKSYYELITKPSIDDMKDKLKRIPGFAVSNVQDQELKYSSLIKYDVNSK